MTALYLFFKAFQPGLFDQQVQVSGHVTKRGTVVAPYHAKRKKRPEPPPGEDLFAQADRKAMEAEQKKAKEDAERKAREEAEKTERKAAERKAKEAEAAKKEKDEDSDDPNSPNYRFRDTGYIAGSRKEEAASMIRRAGRDGTRLTAQDIDWEQIEKNPREAKELITKSNLFGSVDWEALKAGGMEPGAGFLLDRVYASIAKEPDEDLPEARKLFAIGLQSVRDRLERCKTPTEITAAINEMREELEGTMLTAEQAAELQPLSDARDAAYQTARDAEKAIRDKWDFAYAIEGRLNAKKYEQQKRAQRKWKPDPDLDREIRELTAEKESAYQAWKDYSNAHPEAVTVYRTEDLGGGRTAHYSGSPLEEKARELAAEIDRLKRQYRTKNTLENPLFRAWTTLGSRFVGVLRYRSFKGSDAFGEHVARAKAGKITDWSWADKEGKTAAPKVTKGEVTFTLKVAEKYERKGGRKIAIGSTAALKKEFGLRDVQSGNWVLEDPNSAKWHVQQAAEAFADLADILGVPDELVSMKGRLALAFGARGKGNLGFQGAARAHYEPVQRVINITKMGGGGCLAHEWFHCLDNLITEAETGKPTGKENFATENLALTGAVGDAVRGLVKALIIGPHRHVAKHTYTGHDVRLAEANLKATRNAVPAVKIIMGTGNVHDAVQRLQAYFAESKDRRAKKNEADWTRIAVAHYGADPNGGTLEVKSGAARSSFAHEAVKLDRGVDGKYWSKTIELAARAFQSYTEDKLASMGRRSDYLSALADNKHYMGDRPFPEGEERTRINEAFDRLIAAMRESKTLEKAARIWEARYLFLKAAA